MDKPMEHTKFKDQIQFYLYNELSMKDRNIFENHISTCKECAQELIEYKKLFEEFNKDNKQTIDPQFLNEARSELRGYLRAQRNKSSNSNYFLNSLSRFLFRPIGFAFSGIILLVLGGFISYLIFNPLNEKIDDNLQLPERLKIQNINFIDSDPSDGEVEFTFETVKSDRMKGNVNDIELQKILTYAVLNEQNPGTRLNSINVINANQTQKPDDEIKSTLITVAKFDNNPGVRIEALKSLNKLPADEEIKNTLIYVLLNDTSAGIRIEAINGLVDASKTGISLNQEDLTSLRDKIQIDDNNYIRYQAKNIIKEY